MTIPTLAPTPVRGDPDTFSTAFETFLSGLDPWAVAVQAVGDAADADATAAAASAVDAAASAVDAANEVALAAAQAALAETHADAAAGSALVAGAIAWVSGTTYATGDTRYSPINFQTYRRTTDGGGTTDPSLDSANWVLALNTGITNVITATASTTLTSTPTLLQITPASYGVAVKLPDATTCSVGGPLHIIDNRGAYPVRVLNSAGTLLGFIFAGVVSRVSLIDNSTAAGVWTVENSELVGASAQLLTENLMYGIFSCIDIGSNREVLIGSNVSGGAMYAVVYNRSTNAFGLPTLVRNASVFHRLSAVLAGSDKVLVVSNNSGTSFEAVVLSISGTTITVNTAATATMSAVLSAFADGCGLIAVGSSFVTSYTVTTPAAQIRALSISGTTVTIGSAEVLGGTAGGLIALGDSTHVIAVSTATTHLYTKPYLVSGSTLTAGTGTDTNSGTMTLNKLAALGTRWYVGYNDGGTTVKGGVVSLNATGNGTTTISAATLFSAGTLLDAILISSSKMLVLGDQSTNNANILTDSAGTASAGTAITLDGQTTRACLYVSGTDVAVQSGATTYLTHMVGCSGASPVLTKTITTGGSSVEAAAFSVSDAVLSRSPKAVYGTAYARNVWMSAVTQNFDPEIKGGVFRRREHTNVPGDNTSPGVAYRGKSASEIWIADATTVITKVECVQ